MEKISKVLGERGMNRRVYGRPYSRLRNSKHFPNRKIEPEKKVVGFNFFDDRYGDNSRLPDCIRIPKRIWRYMVLHRIF
jgi:hypothetical protein